MEEGKDNTRCSDPLEPQPLHLPPPMAQQPTTVFSRLTKQVIDPLIRYSMGRIYPYMLMTATLFILTFFIAIAILVILLKRW